MPIVRAFGAGAVVAADVDDQRVVELAHVLDRLDHAADLVVGVGDVGGEDLGLAGEQLLLVGAERVPLRQLGAAVLGCHRPGVSWVFAGITPSCFWLAKICSRMRVPAHVELALELVDPLLRRMVRRVGAAGDVVDEERLVRRGRVELLQVVDGVVGHAGDQVVARACRRNGKICVVLRNRYGVHWSVSPPMKP